MLAGPVVSVCGGRGHGVTGAVDLGPPAVEAGEGARRGPPALVPTGEGSPQLMGALAGPDGGVYGGGEGHRDVLAPDPTKLVADLVPTAAEVAVVAWLAVHAEAHGAHIPHADPALASMVGMGGEGEGEVGAPAPTQVSGRSSG